MRADDTLIPIRSYSLCFRLERRIHKIDRWRVPLSYGIPLSGLGWAVVVLLMVLVAERLPGLGLLVGALHPALRLVIVPVAAAYFLSRWRIDGRPPLAAAIAYTRWRTTPRRLVAFQRHHQALVLGEVVFAPDGRGARLRAGVVRGPALLVLRYPAALKERSGTLHVTPQAGPPLWRGTEVQVHDGQRVVVHG